MSGGFIGSGWSFPPTFNRRRAGVDMLEDEADIISSLKILLGTTQGERLMQPHYGCNLDELLFESLDTRMKTLIADKIESAILYHEPRIELIKAELDDSSELEGIVLITIEYRVKSTNSRFNMVYPYCIVEGTETEMPVTVIPVEDN